MRPTTGLYLRHGDAIDAATSDRVLAEAAALRADRLPGVTEIIPSYASLYLEFDSALLGPSVVRRWADRVLDELAGGADGVRGGAGRVVRVPVRYDGVDLDVVAAAAGISPGEAARRHAAVEYRVYAVGFTPGFPFMGAVDPTLRLPRLTTPRARVEPHTVAIADAQTGIYPLASPGGWRLVGTTLEAVYDSHRERPFLLEPGDRVWFVPTTVGPQGEASGAAPPEPSPLTLLPEEPRHPVLTVAEPGLLDLVVDAGRYGAGHFGLARGGPLDARSARLANLLVGNEAGAPLLEFNVSGPVLEVERRAVVAFAGWGVRPVLNGAPVAPFSSFLLSAGERLEFPPQSVGVRGYLAVAGGLESERFMGSASVDVRGLIGRPLRAGDRLGLASERPARPGFAFEPHAGWHVQRGSRGTAHDEVRLRILPGPQADREAMAALTSSPFRVQHADRMGLQLDGPQVPGGGVLSEANPLGAVQVTPSGKPLVLLHDRGTIGGYTKPAVIHPADLPVAGQLRTGDLVRFERSRG